MDVPLIVVDRSDVRPGKAEALRAALRDLAAFVEANEPRPLAYRAHLSSDGRSMTVVQVHPDSASMENHMRVAAPRFPAFRDLLRLRAVDVYGDPSSGLLAALREKVALLGDATLAVHHPEAGFVRDARFPPSPGATATRPQRP